MASSAHSALQAAEADGNLAITTKKYMPLHLLPDTAYSCIVSLLGFRRHKLSTSHDMSKDLKKLSLLAKWSLEIVSRETTCLALKERWPRDCDPSSLVSLLIRRRESLKQIEIHHPGMLSPFVEALLKA